MRSVSRPKEKATRPSSLARISMPSALSVFRLMAGPMRSGLMSQLGLGRVKMAREGRRYREQKAEWVSGRDRSDQRLDPDDVHDPCQIVGRTESAISALTFGNVGGAKQSPAQSLVPLTVAALRPLMRPIDRAARVLLGSQ